MIINIASVRRLVGMVLVSASLASLAACSAATGEEMSVEDGSAEVVSQSAHFETFVGKDGQHYFSLVAGNGQNVLRSEGYATVAGMNGGIASVVANGVDLTSYDILQAKNGEFYFNLKSANGLTVATSETYSTKSNAQRASRTVRGLILLTGASPEATAAIKRKRFEVFTGEDKKAYFHLRAGNGELVLQSQGYTTKQSAATGIASVKANGVLASQWQIVETVDGQFSIRLTAKNGQVIARGESYVSKSGAQSAITTIGTILARVTETAQ